MGLLPNLSDLCRPFRDIWLATKWPKKWAGLWLVKYIHINFMDHLGLAGDLPASMEIYMLKYSQNFDWFIWSYRLKSWNWSAWPFAWSLCISYENVARAEIRYLKLCLGVLKLPTMDHLHDHSNSAFQKRNVLKNPHIKKLNFADYPNVSGG